MTSSNPHPRHVRQARLEPQTHLFTIGQSVRLRNIFSRSLTDIYRITGTMPARGDSPQYRIRRDDERHERVTTQDALELVVVNSSETLIERTFGHGQGTEAQQS